MSTEENTYGRYKNMGNTCYMGSILHILQYVPIFANYFYTGDFNKAIINKAGADKDKLQEYVSYHIFRLFNYSLTNNNITITPETFRECIGEKCDMWLENSHQDSQEFLNFIISQVEEEIGIKMKMLPGRIKLDENTNSNNKNFLTMMANLTFNTYQLKEYSPLKEMFGGLLLTKTKCEYCSDVRNIFDPINMLQLSIPSGKEEYTLNECFDFFLKQERLEKDEAINCEFCGFKSKAYKNYLIWKTPKVLIIQLKRFEKLKNRKLTNNIIYPLYDLDLSNYMDPDSPHRNESTYNLIGINFHDDFNMGRIDFGHYTSMVRTNENEWFYYNDEKIPIKVTKKDQLQNKKAYMLIYYRNN